MSSNLIPPPPPKPDFNEGGQKKSLWTIAFAVIALVFIFVVLTFLTLGLISPLVIIGLIFFGVIALQYFVWGWLFERIYRSNPEHSDESKPT